DFLADLQPVRLQDVALFAIDIMQQRDTRGAVRIVLDSRDCRRHSMLVALEIDQAVGLLVPAADEARADPARARAPAGSLLALDQRLLRDVPRDVVARDNGLEPPRRRRGTISFNRHS